MATLLGIDIETTGLDPNDGNIIEVGICLWEVEGSGPVATYSVLVDGDVPFDIPEQISGMTGIKTPSIRTHGQDIDDVMNQISVLANEADYLVAHNHQFEKSWMESVGYEIDMPWIDTMTDIPYKPGKGKGSLSEIAMAHGVFNPMPHRALFDVIAMMQVLSQYDFEEVVRYCQASMVKLAVKFPYDETGEKNKAAKSLGFRWNPDNKWWDQQVKEFKTQDVIKDAKEAGFSPFLVESEVAA